MSFLICLLATFPDLSDQRIILTKILMKTINKQKLNFWIDPFSIPLPIFARPLNKWDIGISMKWIPRWEVIIVGLAQFSPYFAAIIQWPQSQNKAGLTSNGVALLCVSVATGLCLITLLPFEWPGLTILLSTRVPDKHTIDSWLKKKNGRSLKNSLTFLWTHTGRK